jgi:CheY-like chemotaxis protein
MDGTGIVTLRVSASIIDNQDKMHYNLECSVSDNGMGMTEEQKNIILDSFWINLDNVSLASRPNYDSSGLGLAIAQKLTQLMDGDLWLGACELDKGTQFIFNILVEEDEYPSYITKLSLKSIKGKKALIVDSDSSVRIRLFTSLSKWGLECVLCPSYDELMTIHLRSISQSYDIMYIGESIIGACKPKDIVANIRSLREHTPIIVIQMTGDYEEKVQYRISYPIDDKELMMTTINALNTDVKTDLNLDSVHILIAEDNAINCMVLENLLPKLGYKNYTIKNNGREALAEIMSQPYQYKIVLIDIRMPIMDGITLSEEIWKYYNNMIKSPGYMPYMIGVSAQPMVPGDSMGKLKTFVSKPIDIKKMDQALSEALRDHS